MVIIKAQWQALEAKIIADWTEGVHVGNYSIGRRSFGFANIDGQRKLLQFVQAQIQTLTPGSEDGEFQLVRFADI